MKYAWIRDHAHEFPIQRLCAALGVSRSGYYDWRDREPSAREKERQALDEAIARLHDESYRLYGYRKIHQDLLDEGVLCCPETVRRRMREMNRRARIKRRYKVTTDSNHQRPVAGNVLKQDFSASRPNTKWVADITYLPTGEGWVYLAAIMDLFSRRIVGWAMSKRIDTAMVARALQRAVRARQPDQTLLHHSDRGCQYASEAYQDLLQKYGFAGSMSRPGNCYDNASMERFFGSLKTEWTAFRQYRTREEAMQHVFEYVEVFYNPKRRHQSLDYLSPVAYEEKHAREKRRPAA